MGYKRRRVVGPWLAVLMLAGTTASAETVSVVFDPPKRVVYRDADNRVQRRVIAGYDLDAVQMGGSVFRRIAWADLGPRTSWRVLNALIDDRDAEGWINAGLILRPLEADPSAPERRRRTADAAFDRAIRIDPSLRPRVEALREGRDPPEAAPPPDAPAPEPSSDTPSASPPDAAPGWPILSPPQHAELTAAETRWALDHLEGLGLRIRVVESAHFTLLVDRALGASDARTSLDLLERMYEQLLVMFDLTPDDQVYAGRCVVVVLRRREDFLAYERRAYDFDASRAGGVCHYRPSGAVHIVAFRSEDEWWYRSLLVHENVHGFLHRYRSPTHVASWLNEGLAEYLAHRLVPRTGIVEKRRRAAHAEFHKQDLAGLSRIFERWLMESWAYGLAYGLTDLMIRADPDAYARLIHDIKDGRPWRDALRDHYRADPQRLLSLYAESHGLPTPQP
ncbi:MAG: hypothetical protein AAF710_05690 [Planctomycetota bacterium]